MDLSKQCEKVYEYIQSHPGCTKLDIITATGIVYPSERIAALRKAGVPVIVIGKKKQIDGGSFNQFAIREASLDTLPIPGLLPTD
jgi:Helix-turn-helix domain